MSSAWKTPYDLYDERRSVSRGQSVAGTADEQGRQPGETSPASIADTINVRGIAIAGWRIETHRGSIADSKTIDGLSDAWGIPLPEMPFDKNRLVLSHEPTGWQYCFDGLRALQSVEGVDSSLHNEGIEMNVGAASTGFGRSGPSSSSRRNVLGEKPKSKRVKVAYASEWGKKRNSQQSPGSTTSVASHFGPEVAAAAAKGDISTARDYDWTYSCHWAGCMTSQTQHEFRLGTDPARDRIPLERLGPPPSPSSKAEPILFFDDVILYEDELGDNGTSMLSVKVRVMPTGFLVLQRFFLRVDNVVFRVFDTRLYVAFYPEEVYMSEPVAATAQFASSSAPTSQMAGLSLGAPRRSTSGMGGTQQSIPHVSSSMRVIRECSGSQARYGDVKARLPPYKSNDLSLLTDIGWVAQQIGQMEEQKERQLRRHFEQHQLHPGTMVSRIAQADPTTPAVLPSATVPGHESNRILGEVQDAAMDEDGTEMWEGQGHRIDVLELPS